MRAFDVHRLDHLCVANLSGTFDLEASKPMWDEVLRCMDDQPLNVLVDCRASQVEGGPRVVLELTRWLRAHRQNGDGHLAFVIDSWWRSDLNQLQFFEAVAELNGFDVRLFTDDARARSWLESYTP